MASHALEAVDDYFNEYPSLEKRSASGFHDFCLSDTDYADVFVCDGYRLCRAAKLLMSLGYGNFVHVIQYDVYAMAEAYFAEYKSWSYPKFITSDYFFGF